MPLNSHLQVWICCLSYFHLILPNFFNIYCRVILCKLCRHFKPTLQLCSYCCHCLCCQYYFFYIKKKQSNNQIIYISIKGCHTDLSKYSSHLLSEANVTVLYTTYKKQPLDFFFLKFVKTGLVSHWYYNHKHARCMRRNYWRIVEKWQSELSNRGRMYS